MGRRLAEDEGGDPVSGPDHSSLPLEAIRQRLWRTHLNDRDPQQALEHAYMMAHDEAEDAAREVLELVALPDSITMEPHVWEYFGEVLGRYDTTIPTGERTGKRWCREFGGKRWVAEYTETSIVWRPVTLDTSFGEPHSQRSAEDELAGLRSQLEEERVVRAALLNRAEKADARVAELEGTVARLEEEAVGANDACSDLNDELEAALAVLRPLAEWGPLAESLDVAEFRVDVANADAVLAKYPVPE